ncbi:MAG TPA: HXXEE domain-containing protein [Allosphingosinicella sp.]|jgi:hypothetical protein
MPFDLPGEAASLGFFSLLLAIAMTVAVRRRGSMKADRVVPAACLALAVQALHVAEEFATRFHVVAPELFGLQPWSDAYFIWVNMAAIAGWALAIAAVASGRGHAFWAGLLWFLALASLGNALWHPAASIALGAYFPGTITAPLLGIAGFVLARRLAES